MFYNRSEANKIQRYLFGASCAALATIIIPSLWSGPEPVAIMCGSSWITGSLTDWMISTSVGWLLMVIAMMTPLSLQPILHIRISSFSDRRWSSTTLFLIGYAAIWVVGGWGLKALAIVVSTRIKDPSLQAGAFALIACLWQTSPFKQRCLNKCHSHRPLSAFGRAADIDALRFGVEHGIWCLGSCWVLMLFADSLLQWHIAGMIAVSLLMYSERMDPPMHPSWKVRGGRTTYQRLRLAVWVKRRQISPLVERTQ